MLFGAVLSSVYDPGVCYYGSSNASNAIPSYVIPLEVDWVEVIVCLKLWREVTGHATPHHIMFEVVRGGVIVCLRS